MKAKLILITAITVGTVGCGGQVGPDGQGSAVAADTYSVWRIARTARQSAVDTYLTKNDAQYRSFKNAPLGDTGIPMIMFRVCSRCCSPTIWGAASRQFARRRALPRTHSSRVACCRSASARSARHRPIPVPTPNGVISVNVRVAQLTCVGCHAGRVVGHDGTVKNMIGAPSTQFNQFRGADRRDGRRSALHAGNFLAALNAGPLGWVYGLDPALVQQEAARARGLQRAGDRPPPAPISSWAASRPRSTPARRASPPRSAPTPTRCRTRPILDGSTPGYLDAIGAGITIIADPTMLNTPSSWPRPAARARRDRHHEHVGTRTNRPAAQWDGSIPSQIHRNLGAEFGVVGDPAHLNMDNVESHHALHAVAAAAALPVRRRHEGGRARQGLYVQDCASLPHRGQRHDLPDGAGRHRRQSRHIWTPFSVGGLRQVLRAGCTDAVTCNNPDGSPLPDDEIVRKHRRLHGATARRHLGARAVPAQRLGADAVRAPDRRSSDVVLSRQHRLRPERGLRRPPSGVAACSTRPARATRTSATTRRSSSATSTGRTSPARPTTCSSS